jgi:hypothetical protein
MADFTSDGILDEMSSTWSEVVVRPGRGDGTFGNPIRSAISTAWGAPALAAADFNNDGALDVFTADWDFHENWTIANALLGSGDGRFSLWETLQFGTYWSGNLGTRDINHDGLTDVAIPAGYDPDTGALYHAVLFNDGDWGNSEPPPPPPPTTPNLSIDPATVTEGNAGAVSATFTVRLSAASSEAITIDYATADGTATVGSDYQPTSGTLTFAPGETTKTLTVLVNGDRRGEPNETFVVNLSGPTNAIIANGQGTGTIRDDEPLISINDVSKSEGRKGRTTLFTFTVRLSVPSDQPVTMSFRTMNDTAKTSDGDYVARTGTLTFAPGETAKTITIEVKGDSKREANEYFYLDLFNNSGNSWFSKKLGIGTILNDD